MLVVRIVLSTQTYCAGKVNVFFSIKFRAYSSN